MGVGGGWIIMVAGVVLVDRVGGGGVIVRGGG